jgi:hypothetical protein
LTLTSVAWADSSTAASSSNTLVYSSSVCGCGLAAASVAKKFQVLPLRLTISLLQFSSLFCQRFCDSISGVRHMRMAMLPPVPGAICTPCAFICASICLRICGGMSFMAWAICAV